MTPIKLTNRLKKIDQAKKDGYWLEALLTTYHLNVEMALNMLQIVCEEKIPENKKTKKLLDVFKSEISENQQMKAIINKRTFKHVQIWFDKSDTYFKSFIQHPVSSTKALVAEGEKVAGILNISINKLHSR